MCKPFATGFILLVLSFGMLASCSKSNDQRDFENEALRTPSGITETNANGEVVGEPDNDDWRISPMYRGLISINSSGARLPYPNPLPYNQKITIGLYLGSLETLNRLEVYSFKDPNQLSGRIYNIEGLNPPGYEEITLSGSNISGSAGGSQADGLYRVLIYDGQQNLITYGDVQIGATQ